MVEQKNIIDLDGVERIYFIGIGGIGMSAIARYFKFHGKEVSGYDKTETPLTRELVSEGMAVHYEDNPQLAPRNAQLVVYTPAVPKDHRELGYFRKNNYTILKRSEVLGAITEKSFNICVAGTHGKTTITAMIAHILRHSGFGCNAFLGGIAVNYNSNFWSSERNLCVMEADEFDRSFLKLSPDMAVITAMDADHLDIYGTEEAVQQAFIEFSGKVKPNGQLLSKFGLPKNGELKAANHKTYSLQNEKADLFAENIRIIQGTYEYDVRMKEWKLDKLQLNMGGLHNVENSIAAIGIAHWLDIPDEKIRLAVEAFRGVKRRFEYIIPFSRGKRDNGRVFIDDYAHHPEELKALIGGARNLFPGMKCTLVFQPHLYTRTRDFADGFAKSLDLADEVILLPIYPAREMPIEGVTGELILEKMKNENKRIMGKQELLSWLKVHPVELFITAGAGDIDTLIIPIKESLEKMN